MKISASLVLYKNNRSEFERAVSSFLQGCDGILYIVDNSPAPLESEFFKHCRVKYIYAGENLGFGRGHNLASMKACDYSDFHIFINPDIYFDRDIIPNVLAYVKCESNIGALMPRVNYPDGSLQCLAKLLPTPIDLIFRRFIPFNFVEHIINQRYELCGLSQSIPSCVPSLSGCFLVVRSKIFKLLGGFDERFFMYMEDVDLVRRIGDVAETVYLPSVQVIHAYAKGSYRNRRLLGYHLRSAIQYFNKWGWLFDRTRKARNRQALECISDKQVRNIP